MSAWTARPDGSGEQARLAVVCTDAGQHARARLAELTVLRFTGHDPIASVDRSTWEIGKRGRRERPEPAAETIGGRPASPQNVQSAQQFTCPRCHRAQRVSNDQLGALAAGLVDLGRSEVDISHLG